MLTSQKALAHTLRRKYGTYAYNTVSSAKITSTVKRRKTRKAYWLIIEIDFRPQDSMISSRQMRPFVVKY